MSVNRLIIRGLPPQRYGLADLDLPLQQLICLRGGVGSGAQALARDVLLGESRRRFLRALTPRERERFGGLGSPVEIEEIGGLPPAQFLPGAGARGPVLDCLNLTRDLIRLLATAVERSCPHCGGVCRRLDDEEAVRAMQSQGRIDARCLVIAPLALSQTPTASVFDELVRAGFPRLLVDGQVMRIDSDQAPGREGSATAQTLQIVVDRLVPSEAQEARLGEAIRNARAMGEGRVLLWDEEEQTQTWFNRHHSCRDCGREIAEPAWDEYLTLDDMQISDDLVGMHLGDRPLTSLPSWQLADLSRVLEELTQSTSTHLHPLLARMQRSLAPQLRLGLDALPLFQKWQRLSFGERLALSIGAAIGQGLAGLLYVVDPPLSGLSGRRSADLLAGLRDLVDLGNTVVLVDAESRICEQADLVIDFPAQEGGGRMAPGKSADGGGMLVLRPRGGDAADDARRSVHLAADLELDLPLSRLICIEGESGSGKTSVLREIRHGLPGAGSGTGDGSFAVDATGIRRCVDLTGADETGEDPSGRERILMQVLLLSRDLARLFASTPAAEANQIPMEWFELERPGGRCAHCEGQGQIRYQLDFVEDLIVVCPRCEGRRFRDEVFEATLRGASLADILDMSVEEAARFFHREQRICNVLQAAAASGMASTPLGLNEGRLDRQMRLRARLAAYFGRADRRDLFLVERPGAGEDHGGAEQIREALRRLVSTGATVIATTGPAVRPVDADCVVKMTRSAGKMTALVEAATPV